MIKLIEEILKLFLKEEKMKTTKGKGSTVESILKKRYPNAFVVLLDHTYKVPNMKDFFNWLKIDMTNEKKYKADDFDCEDFAMKVYSNSREQFGSITFGMVMNSDPAHAYNVIICEDEDGEAVIFDLEPQNDTITEYSKETVWLVLM